MLVLSLAGCHEPKTLNPVSHVPPAIQTPGPAPTYAELVRGYNRNLAGLDRLWSRTDVTMEWFTEGRDYHRRGGEGKLIVVREGRAFDLDGSRPGVVLTVGALGRTFFWAGSNTRRYWLFDLRGDGKAYVGRFDEGGRLRSRPLPMPVHPTTAPYLLGLMPIDLSRGRGSLRPVNGYYQLQPPGSNLKYLFHPRTSVPVRITLLGPNGEDRLIAHLEDYAKVERAGWAENNWPWLATDIELYPTDREAKLSLELSAMTDGRSRNRINPAVFNFNALVQAHDPAEVIDLDR